MALCSLGATFIFVIVSLFLEMGESDGDDVIDTLEFDVINIPGKWKTLNRD